MADHNQNFLDFCLLIPCYNNEAGLVKSLRSIYYDRGKYLILLVDDGSREPVNLARIQKQLDHELPIELLTLEKNAGITTALNVGLNWIHNNIRSKYVARLDCGDTCQEQRFYRQVKEMDNDPQLLLLGTWCRFVHPDGKSYIYTTPTEDAQVKRGMFFRNLFIHPTFMIRLPNADKPLQYPTAYSHAEDYALAWQLMKQGSARILPEVLVDCEINSTGISESNRRVQLRSRQKVIRDFAVNNILKLRAQIYLFILRIIPRKLILAYKLRKQ